MSVLIHIVWTMCTQWFIKRIFHLLVFRGPSWEMPSAPLVRELFLRDLRCLSQACSSLSGQSAPVADLPNRLHHVRVRCVSFIFFSFVYLWYPIEVVCNRTLFLFQTAVISRSSTERICSSSWSTALMPSCPNSSSLPKIACPCIRTGPPPFKARSILWRATRCCRISRSTMRLLVRPRRPTEGSTTGLFIFLFSCFCVPFWFIGSVFSLFSLFLFLVSFRNLNLIILRKVGKIGGDESKVRARVGHILACISKDIDFSVADVKVSTFCLFLCLFCRLISCASSLDWFLCENSKITKNSRFEVRALVPRFTRCALRMPSPRRLWGEPPQSTPGRRARCLVPLSSRVSRSSTAWLWPLVSGFRF